jgi:dCTP deaminase
MSEGGILSGPAIRQAIERGEIEIDPFVPEHVNPVSVDLTLGDEVLVYQRWVERGTLDDPILGISDIPGPHYLDVREKPGTITFALDKRGIILRPGIGYLMHTRERVHTRKYVPVLDGKSSIGRLFMVVHVTAGFGDPGFNGQYTLEVTVTHPLRVYAGMRVAQMRFHTIVGEPELYQGNYTGDGARGPVASRAYRQFLPKADT